MKYIWMGAVAALSVSALAGSASAQLAHSPILGGSVESMRGEVQKRYDAALAATKSREIIAANDVRYTWASEAKVACGIAIGFLKTSTVDEDSINKCDDYSHRMAGSGPIMALPAPPPEPVAAAPCAVQLPILFYFPWDADQPPAEATSVAATTVQQMQACGWKSLHVTGYADSSGATPYNQALSERRARNVAALLTANGVAADALTVEAFGESRLAVQTGDGVREPLNRRVEITTGAAQ